MPTIKLAALSGRHLSFLLSSFTSLWQFNALTRCPDLLDHFTHNSHGY